MLVEVQSMKKVSVNEDLCIACGLCYTTCVNVFEANANGTSRVVEPLVEDDDTVVMSVVENCPIGAISIEDVEDENCDCENGTCECGEECNCENCSCEK